MLTIHFATLQRISSSWAFLVHELVSGISFRCSCSAHNDSRGSSSRIWGRNNSNYIPHPGNCGVKFIFSSLLCLVVVVAMDISKVFVVIIIVAAVVDVVVELIAVEDSAGFA